MILFLVCVVSSWASLQVDGSDLVLLPIIFPFNLLTALLSLVDDICYLTEPYCFGSFHGSLSFKV